MARILGILNLHNESDLGVITSKRSLAALTFLGRYSFCDIPLSNFGNSQINSTAILVKNNIRSIIKHIDDSQGYAENTKLGQVVLLYNEKYANDALYNTDINNLIENEWLLNENNYAYVVIAPTHLIYRMNFQDVLKQHIASGGGITACYKKIDNGKKAFINANTYIIDEAKRLRGIRKNKGTDNQINVAMETYIFDTAKLSEILKFSIKTSQIFSLNDLIKYLCTTMDIHTYEYEGYLRYIDDLAGYFNTSLELLDPSVIRQLTSSDWPIYTKTHDTPPARYSEEAVVRNSFISNGALIEGVVENSIVCRNVRIGKNTRIRNSIILSDTFIGESAVLENAIVDKECKVIYKKEIIGKSNRPIYVKQGDTI